MTDTDSRSGGLTWLLDSFAERVPDVRHAVILSSDGIMIASTAGLARNDADHLAAIASGFQSLAAGAGETFDVGEVRQTVVDLTRGYLFVTAAGEGARIAVLASSGADAGLVAYEMSMLVRRMGEHMTTTPRHEAGLFGTG
ncbi:roadblock/LC7 domain-containing protein [Actinocatenispora rupis]|uniref:Dynein regulation protein LC7 n=1 Tax=Actinocatenispora rupis TaxID=519421 RepID=A0A8J3JEN2_9ACTN|nr:roadblock/LC7 domain-containing protein [Actinocatenispora rupis]GID15309.1 dynein regulation protein LC7 [Actinocatenispora rupis]